MLQLYSSTNKGSTPLGLRVRFIPNANNGRFVMSSRARLACKKAQSKQVTFLSKTRTAKNINILGLDYKIAELGCTLREAIMSLRASTNQERALFAAVEMEKNSNTVTFVYHSDVTEDAMGAIPALPLILEAQLLSPRVWGWFAESAQETTAGYKWDPEQGVVACKEEEAWDDWDGNFEDNKDVENPLSNMGIISMVLGNPGKGAIPSSSLIATRLFNNNESQTTHGSSSITSTADKLTLLALMQNTELINNPEIAMMFQRLKTQQGSLPITPEAPAGLGAGGK